MEDLYRESQNLPMDVTNPSSTIANNKLENGVTQLITAEAWNINSTGLMKKALPPLVTVPTTSILSPPADSQSGVALKVAATVLQPICLGDSPVVLPIHLQVGGSTAPQLNSNSTPYVMTTQGPVPLPLLLEQHVFQHLNSPLVLPQGTQYIANPLQGHLYPVSNPPAGQPQMLDQKPSTQTQESVLPPLFQTPGFAAVLQDLFPSQNSMGSSHCQGSPDYFSANLHSIPPQAFSSPLSPLVPPATLLVPYPVIVPLPVPLPIPVPIPIPVPHTVESKVNIDPVKSANGQYHCKSTQTTLEKEEFKPFDSTHKREFTQFNRHTVIKMGNENEALDLSMKSLPLIKRKIEMSPPYYHEEGVLDLSVPSYMKNDNATSVLSEMPTACAFINESAGFSVDKHLSPVTPFVSPVKSHEISIHVPGRMLNSNHSELLRQQKWVVDQSNRACESKPVGNGEAVTFSQTAKVIVSVKDAVPAVFCGKMKGLSGVSTKNFSFKRDMPPDLGLHAYDGKNPPDNREISDSLRKPIKNRNVKLKKIGSQEMHILPIKKQRLAAFFPRK